MKSISRTVEDKGGQLRQLESLHCSHGDTVHYAERAPIFSRCQGSFLYDSEDRPYLDLQMWNSAVNLGYGNSRVVNAVRKQLDTLPQVAPQFLHESRIDLSARISASIEQSFGLKGRVQFSVGGAQAVEESLKVVRRRTGRSRMLAMEGGYHGRTMGTLSLTSSFRYREGLGEFPYRAQLIPFPDCFRCPYEQVRSECELFCAKQMARLFNKPEAGICNPNTGGSEIGAIYIEPVLGTGGYIAPPEGYFGGLEDLCRKYGILIVADEIQMGFFRTGEMWASERLGIRPDIIIFGKSLTNGLNALSGFWAREELLNPTDWPPGSTYATFAPNPIGTAAGVEVMKILSESNYASTVCAKGAQLVNDLTALKGRHPEIGLVDGVGLAIRVEICTADGHSPNAELANRLFQLGLSGTLELRGQHYGLIFGVAGPWKSTLTLAPCLDITPEEMKLGIDLLDQILVRAKSGAG